MGDLAKNDIDYNDDDDDDKKNDDGKRSSSRHRHFHRGSLNIVDGDILVAIPSGYNLKHMKKLSYQILTNTRICKILAEFNHDRHDPSNNNKKMFKKKNKKSSRYSDSRVKMRSDSSSSSRNNNYINNNNDSNNKSMVKN